MGRIVLGNNLDVLRTVPSGSAQLIYIDPPFNTGKTQTMRRVKSVAVEEASSEDPISGSPPSPVANRVTGFGGRVYDQHLQSAMAYADSHDDFLGFIEARLVELHRILADDGSLFFHIDPRESHYCKVLLDSIFGRDAFMNEIIWSYDYGGRSKSKWSAKHDTIFWYVKNPKNYCFNFDAIDRIPYMAPGLVGPEKAARGKTPTDVWWHTIVPTNGRERTGYPTQKPLGILERIVRVHSNPGDLVLDCFAGSGSMGEAAAKHGRNFLLVDANPEAIVVMQKRLHQYGYITQGHAEYEPPAEH